MEMNETAPATDWERWVADMEWVKEDNGAGVIVFIPRVKKRCPSSVPERETDR